MVRVATRDALTQELPPFALWFTVSMSPNHRLFSPDRLELTTCADPVVLLAKYGVVKVSGSSLEVFNII